MMKSVIVITGGSGGLAQALVKAISPEHQLVVVGRDLARLESFYQSYAHVSCLSVDLQDEASMVKLVEHLYQTYGKIDILINNAGYGKFKPFEAFSFEETKAMLAVNTLAPMTLSRLVGQRMKAVGQGHIINIVSMAGLMATAKSSVYSASKFALIGFSNALRLELAETGVYVTTVNPGPIRTAFFDQADPDGAYLAKIHRLMLSPEDVARKIVAHFNRPKREINLPWLLALAHKCYTLFPNLSDNLARKVFNFK